MNKLNLKNIGKEKILLLGLAGIILLVASYFGNIDKTSGSSYINTSNMEYSEKMEIKLKNILETINGISDVSVVISTSDESDYLTKETKEIKGVVLTARGIKDNRETIINIISTLFNVPIHKITVVEIY